MKKEHLISINTYLLTLYATSISLVYIYTNVYPFFVNKIRARQYLTIKRNPCCSRAISGGTKSWETRESGGNSRKYRIRLYRRTRFPILLDAGLLLALRSRNSCSTNVTLLFRILSRENNNLESQRDVGSIRRNGKDRSRFDYVCWSHSIGTFTLITSYASLTVR